MIIVSDTSPISSLFIIGQLDLLRELFGKIVVPPKVLEELQVLESKFGYDLSPLLTSDWIEARDVADKEAVARLMKILDAGESEAIVLAKELQPDYILIDEAEGRAVAKKEGLAVIGVLGVLIRAKRTGKIETLKPLMEDLRVKAKFYMHEHLFLHVLSSVGEQ